MKNDTPRIGVYFHCATCTSGQLAVGWTEQGLQVFCDNCQKNVADIDFMGQKVQYFKVEDENSKTKL